MDEISLHRWVAWGVIAAALPTLGWLLFVTAPYGRHGRPGWGPTLPARAGWILMESPAVFLWLAVYLRGAHRSEIVPLLFLAMWQVHYLHRTLIFPFRLRAGRPVPLVIALLGFGFNGVNAWLNARQVSEIGAYPLEWLWTPWFAAGAALFVVGLVTNLYADTVLLNLRAPGEQIYRIPRTGPFRWVSCPNYLGEMVEWGGWALATGSLAGLSFLVFTVANLVPRALAHHRWYRATFPDYPPERAAVVPFLL